MKKDVTQRYNRWLVRGLMALVLTCFGCKNTPEEPAPNAEETLDNEQKTIKTAELPSRMENAETIPPKTTLPDWNSLSWTPLSKGSDLMIAEVDTILESQGFALLQYPWKSETSQGVAWIVRIKREGSFGRVLPSKTVRPLSKLVSTDKGPWVVINGGFYEHDSEGNNVPMGVVLSGSHLEHDYVHRGGSGILLMQQNKDRHSGKSMKIIHRNAWKDAKPPRVTDALQSIDRIIDKSKLLVKKREHMRHTARSAVALSHDHIWVIAAAARGSIKETSAHEYKLVGTSFKGLSLYHFAELVQGLTSAEQALNLDGAVSTQLRVQTMDEMFDVQGERGTINALEFRPPRR